MKKNFKALALLLLSAFLMQACAPRAWQANWHMFQAESAAAKAYEMRVKKNLRETRLKLYRQACDHAKEAYRLDPGVFTLMRIEMAQDACFRVEDLDAREVFLEFFANYEAAHPTEATYGDAFPALEA